MHFGRYPDRGLPASSSGSGLCIGSRSRAVVPISTRTRWLAKAVRECCASPSKESAGRAVSCCSSSGAALHDQLGEILSQFDANTYAASVRVHAVKGNSLETRQEGEMSKVQIYDKAMCCSTGVCSVRRVDPVLPRFAAGSRLAHEAGSRRGTLQLSSAASRICQQRGRSANVDGLRCRLPPVGDGRRAVLSAGASTHPVRIWLRGTNTKLPKPTLPIASNDGCCDDTGCC